MTLTTIVERVVERNSAINDKIRSTEQPKGGDQIVRSPLLSTYS